MLVFFLASWKNHLATDVIKNITSVSISAFLSVSFAMKKSDLNGLSVIQISWPINAICHILIQAWGNSTERDKLFHKSLIITVYCTEILARGQTPNSINHAGMLNVRGKLQKSPKMIQVLVINLFILTSCWSYCHRITAGDLGLEPSIHFIQKILS